MPMALVVCGPYSACAGTIWRPASWVVYAPVRVTVYVVRIGAPPIAAVTGICSTPEEDAPEGVKVTVREQVAAGARVPQLLEAAKVVGFERVGAPICSAPLLVFV